MAIFPFLVLLFSCIHCRPTREEEKYVISTEHVEVEKVAGDVYRHKRSAIVFPEAMQFQFRLQAGDVEMNLEKAAFPSAPVYTIEPSGFMQRDQPIKGDYALYQDRSLGGSLLVKYPSKQDVGFELHGSFIYKGENYQIAPSDDALRHRRDTSDTASHKVQKHSVPFGDFSQDAVYPPTDEYPEAPRRGSPSDTGLIDLKQRTGSNGPEMKTVSVPFGNSNVEPPGRIAVTSSPLEQTQSEDTVYIEYLIIVDYRNFEKWKGRYSGETEDEHINNTFDAMYEYYQFIVNGIDIRFHTITSGGPKFSVVLAGLMVSMSAETSPWLKGNQISDNIINDLQTLFSFAKWKRDNYDSLPKHDHAALYTGFDLGTRYSSSTLGMAFLNCVCLRDWGVSESEEVFNAIVIHIAAHELGHSVGSHHDGHDNDCSSRAMNLMAPSIPVIHDIAKAPNPWIFSKCSQSAIQSFVAALGQSSCLRDVPEVLKVNKVAGIVYSADDQCNMTFDGDAGLCREGMHYQWDTMCYGMQCKRKGESSCTGHFFPFEGTPCGNKKWCQGGRCVYSEDALPTHDTCIFGDDPYAECDKASCDDSNIMERDVTCCGTCLNRPNTTSAPETTTTLQTSTTSHSVSPTFISTSALDTSSQTALTSELPPSTHSSTTKTPASSSQPSLSSSLPTSTKQSFTSKPAPPTKPSSTTTLVTSKQPSSTTTLVTSKQPSSTTTLVTSKQPSSTTTLVAPKQPSSTISLVTSTSSSSTTAPATSNKPTSTQLSSSKQPETSIKSTHSSTTKTPASSTQPSLSSSPSTSTKQSFTSTPAPSTEPSLTTTLVIFKQPSSTSSLTTSTLLSSTTAPSTSNKPTSTELNSSKPSKTSIKSSSTSILPSSGQSSLESVTFTSIKSLSTEVPTVSTKLSSTSASATPTSVRTPSLSPTTTTVPLFSMSRQTLATENSHSKSSERPTTLKESEQTTYSKSGQTSTLTDTFSNHPNTTYRSTMHTSMSNSAVTKSSVFTTESMDTAVVTNSHTLLSTLLSSTIHDSSTYTVPVTTFNATMSTSDFHSMTSSDRLPNDNNSFPTSTSSSMTTVFSKTLTSLGGETTVQLTPNKADAETTIAHPGEPYIPEHNVSTASPGGGTQQPTESQPNTTTTEKTTPVTRSVTTSSTVSISFTTSNSTLSSTSNVLSSSTSQAFTNATSESVSSTVSIPTTTPTTKHTTTRYQRTTQPLSTSPKIMTTTENVTTGEPKSDLSYELQTMISLFLSVAIVI